MHASISSLSRACTRKRASESSAMINSNDRQLALSISLLESPGTAVFNDSDSIVCSLMKELCSLAAFGVSKYWVSVVWLLRYPPSSRSLGFFMRFQGCKFVELTPTHLAFVFAAFMADVRHLANDLSASKLASLLKPSTSSSLVSTVLSTASYLEKAKSRTSWYIRNPQPVILHHLGGEACLLYSRKLATSCKSHK